MNKQVFSIFIALGIYAGSVFGQPNKNELTDTVTHTKAQPLNSANFIHPYENLNNFLFRIQHNKKITIAFLGGSITNMTGWRDKVCQYFKEKYPTTNFTFINAGIPSLGSLPHAFRLKTDVLNKGRIDLLFFESAVNDWANGTPEVQQRQSIEGIIRHAYSADPFLNIIVMAFVDEQKIANYKVGRIPLEVKVHEDIADHYHLPFINLAEEVSKRIDNKEFTWKGDFKSIHPSPFGQELYFKTIKTFLDSSLLGNGAIKLAAVKLPEPMRQSIYTHGDYILVSAAINKKDFKVNDSWKPSDSVSTRSGFVNVPVLVGEKVGARCDLIFRGTTIGLAVIAGPDAGEIKYSIDDSEEKIIDLFKESSASLHLPVYLLLGDGLQTGKHTVHITIAADHNAKSKGNAVRIVHFLVNRQG